MGGNKLADQVRVEHADCRDRRRVEALPEDSGFAGGTTPTPSRLVAWRELLQKFRDRLSEEERRLADLRGQGRSWADIAAELGGTADARRVQLSRAVTRVWRELGLGDNDHE
jgi:hypothetical protein